jgi:hypothetical protein
MDQAGVFQGDRLMLNPKDLQKLPPPAAIEAALEELDFSDPEQEKIGYELLRKVNFLGALEMYDKSEKGLGND